MMGNQTQIQASSSMIDATTPGSLLVNIGSSLALILLIIAAIAWVARRTGLAQRFPKGNQILSVVCSHSLGQRERVIVMDMGDKRLLLGVTATQISCLATFEKSEDQHMTADSPPSGDFQSTLIGMIKKCKTGSGT
ncbi:flagellar biosynthetic protein FliO [Yersinia mollaretii]|nr:flagellar biosynthetic protein FliO [Yersinia mollaretii]